MKRKKSKSIVEQAELYLERGIGAEERDDLLSVLRLNSYYRISGYARYFQVAPAQGAENFETGTTFSQIIEIYELDRQLRAFVLSRLQLIEVSARTAFVQAEASTHDPYEKYFAIGAYIPPPQNYAALTEDIILSDIRRSQEPFIKRHRTDDWKDSDAWVNEVPIWAAAETFSFGTLSKAIAYRNDELQVYRETCQILGVNNSDLNGQLRAFVSLRNRCAHHGRLWNFATSDQPTVQKKVRSKANKLLGGKYDGNSVVAVIVAMDDYLNKTGLEQGFLQTFLASFGKNADFFKGLLSPRKA